MFQGSPGTVSAGFREVVTQTVHLVVSERNRLGIERVRLDDIGAGLQILAMDLLNNGGLSEIQEIVVALKVFRPIPEPLASKRGLVQPPLLDHGAHGAIKDDDAFLEKLFDLHPVLTVLWETRVVPSYWFHPTTGNQSTLS